MRQTVTLLSFLIFSLQASSQKNGTIKGTSFDTSINKPVPNATLTLMKKKDSSLVTFTMADNNGRFQIDGLPNGEYRLLITQVIYRNAIKYFTIDDDHREITLGNVAMNDKNKTLSEVTVSAEAAPVTLVGDTIQYNAGSFKTRPNANVEDLLKKLPGVKVDKDGTVKAQGEKVQKVLVDGKEFFGNDPKIATKNLPADAIDKVQVYDKLSDQAQITGFDDGNSEKTINLKLKADKKNGRFGKATAGAGTGERYEGKFNFNSFKGARQTSLIAMGNNTNAEGFSFIDILNFTGALSSQKNGGDINISISADDPLAGLIGGNNIGINTTWGSGINYNNIIGTKTDFRSNFFYSHYNPNRQTNIQRQYFSPKNIYKQHSYTDKQNNSQRLNFSADYQIDSFRSLKISPNFSYQKTDNKTVSDYSTFSEQGEKINSSNSNDITNSEGTNLSTNILFRNKFGKRGRTFSLNLLTNFNNSEGNGNLQSVTDFYNGGSLFLSDSINQKNKNTTALSGFNAKAVYTEPIFKKSQLEFSAGRSYTKNTASKTTYDFNKSNGKYDLINEPLTNDFVNTYSYNTAGLRFRRQTKKYSFAVGGAWQQASIEGHTKNLKDSAISKSFTNILPNARLQYNFNRFKNITFNYSTNTNPPSVTQLQPLPDNSNPLYIRLGNPKLQQEFIQTLRLNASLVNPFKNRNLFAFFTAQQTQHKIVNYDRINSLGVDSVLPVNVDGVYNLNGNLSFGFPVHFLKGTMDISSVVNTYHGRQFANTVENTINTITVGPQLRLDISPTDKIDITLSTSFKHSKTTYSLPGAQNSKYFTQEYTIDFNWQFAKKFLLVTDFNYLVNNQYSTGFNTKVPLWNAAISRQVLHFNRGELKLVAKDILNRNVYVNRSANQNYIEDTRVNSLRRFFLLSFTFNLNKTGLSNAENKGGVRVVR
ncbi:MAG: outer membrane beta-barrel protein [Ferruginibacter sp.]